MKPKNGKRRGRKLSEVLEENEQARLLALASNQEPSGIRGQAILRLFISTGLRASELINLKETDVNFTTKRLWVRQGKGGKDRALSFNNSCRLALEAWLVIKPVPSSPTLFTSLDGSRPLCSRWLRRWMARLGEKLGLSFPLHPHTLRHCWACRMLKQTNNLFMVSQGLGHADLGTTQVYLHLHQPDLDAAMQNLDIP